MKNVLFLCTGNSARSVWPGAPARAHWGVDGPAAVEGSDADKRGAFEKAFRELKAQIDAFLARA